MNKKKTALIISFSLTAMIVFNGFWNSSKMEGKVLSQELTASSQLDFSGRAKVEQKFEQRTFKKVSQKSVQKVISKKVEPELNTVSIEQKPVIEEDLSLNLVEFFDPKTNDGVLGSQQVRGRLNVVQGQIQELSFDLAHGPRVSLSSSSFQGNNFRYTYEGREHRGMIYPLNKNEYMVTLSDGPLSGARLKYFVENEVQDYQADVEIAQDQNLERNAEGFEAEFAEENREEGSVPDQYYAEAEPTGFKF